jgi:hypothetical protein
LNTTQSDEFEPEEGVNYLAFTAFVKSDYSPNECDSLVLIETCDKESKNESGEESNLQTAYNQLFKECDTK